MDKGGNPHQYTAEVFEACTRDNQVRCARAVLLPPGTQPQPCLCKSRLWCAACCCCWQVSKGKVEAVQALHDELFARFQAAYPQEAQQYREMLPPQQSLAAAGGQGPG